MALEHPEQLELLKKLCKKGRGVRREPGIMNKLEAEYACLLEMKRRAGEILWFEFDVVKFRLAKDTFYTPDFLVLSADLQLEVHEVKGFWEDDARVKIKVAADRIPIHFIAVTKEKGQWKYEGF